MFLMEMSELLRLVLATGLFFIGCTVVFVTWVMVDVTVQARQAARPAPAMRVAGGGLKSPPVAAPPYGEPARIG
jgi:hypothetical protein